MAEQLIRNEQVVSSILTTSSTPKTLVNQGFSAFLCLKNYGPKTAVFCVCCHFVATCCHPKCRVARMSRLAISKIDVNSVRKIGVILAESALILIDLAKTAMECSANVSYNRNRAGQVVRLPCRFGFWIVSRVHASYFLLPDTNSSSISAAAASAVRIWCV